MLQAPLPCLRTAEAHDRFQPSIIPRLAPKRMEPVGIPLDVDAWQRLERIESIEVVEVAKKIFAIHINFHHCQHHISTNKVCLGHSALQLRPTARPHAPPDFVVVRTDSELAALQQQVFTSVRQFHPTYCELCDGLAMDMYTKLFKLHASRSRANDMRLFLVHLLLQLSDKRALCAASCKGQHELPMFADRFLFCGADEAGPEATP